MAGERVLLVDDEEEFLEVLTERLELRGLVVSVANDGASATKVVGNQHFDVVILDLQMPGMDGIETLSELMAHDPDTQVILLTGRASVPKAVEAMKQGAVDFMEKPPNMADLLERIGRAAEQRTLLLEKREADKIEKLLKSKGW